MKPINGKSIENLWVGLANGCRVRKAELHLWRMAVFYRSEVYWWSDMWELWKGGNTPKCLNFSPYFLKEIHLSRNVREESKSTNSVVYVDPDQLRQGFTSHGCNLFMTSSQLFWSPLPNRKLLSPSTEAEMDLFMQRLCPPVRTITPFVGGSVVPECCFKQQHWHGNPLTAAERFLSRAAVPAL